MSEGRIFLSAGEVSGDHYGAEILAALRMMRPELRAFGLGGLAMEGQGFERVVRAEDVAVMGITEILRHVPRIYASYRRLVRAIEGERPAAAVLIDFPDVNFRLAKRFKRLGVPVIWFVGPQLWAWKRRRLRWVQERVDRMMVIFPFEERFYRARGVKAEFVGHPLATLPLPAGRREDYATAHEMSPEKLWVALLPGSRMREVAANLPEMVRAAKMLAKVRPGQLEFVLPVASGLAKATVQATVDALLQIPVYGGGRVTVRLVSDAGAALRHARASVVASGTATVQAAVIGNPFVVVYRVSAMTFRLAKRLVRYPPEIPAELDADGTLPVAMVNLIAGRRIVPELLNERFTAEEVVRALKPLLADGPERAAQIAGLTEVRTALAAPCGQTSSGTQRVAQAVLELLNTPAAR